MNLIHEKEKINKENEQLKSTVFQLKEVVENLQHQINAKNNEIRNEKLKLEEIHNEMEDKEIQHKKIIDKYLLEIKIKEVELKDYIVKYTSLKQKENGEDNNVQENYINIRNEILDIKKEIEKNTKLELEYEKNIYIKRRSQEFDKKNEELDAKIQLVEIKAEEEIEKYKNELKDNTLKEIEEFKKNFEIIQYNEIHKKEMEIENRYKEAVNIKKQELDKQESKLLKMKKQEIESAFNRIISAKQHEYEDKYKRKIMNLKVISNNNSQTNTIEANKNIVRIINDLKDQISSLSNNLLLEKQINENNNNKIQILEKDHTKKIQGMLQNHFSHINNNTIFNNKTLTLFDKNELEKIYYEINNKFIKNLENENNLGQMNEKSFSEKKLNEILAVLQIYSWKLRETIQDYENKIKEINWNKKMNEPVNINEEFIRKENKYKLLMKEKEIEYLRILTELELDNYLKENKLIENGIYVKNNNFDKNHYESRLKTLEVQYNKCINILESEKEISNRLLTENKDLNHQLIKEKESSKDNAKSAQKYKELYNQYRQKLNTIEDKYKSELRKRSKIIENCIRQMKQKQTKHNKTKTAEFVNIDGVVNTYKRDDDGKAEDYSRQKYQSELTTGDFATSLYTDRFTTREIDDDNSDDDKSKNESSDSEEEDKEIESLQTESFDTTVRTTEISTELNNSEEEEEFDSDEEEDNEKDNNNDDSDKDSSDEEKHYQNAFKNGHESSEEEEESDDSDSTAELSYQKKKNKKEKKKTHKKSKKKSSHDTEKIKNKKDHKKSKSSKKERKIEDSKRKNISNELSISKENIIPNDDSQKKYVLRNKDKDNKNQSIELYDVDDLESSEEEEVSESIKEEIRSLLEDIPELKSKYQILNKTGEGIIHTFR